MDELKEGLAEVIGSMFTNFFYGLDDIVKLAKAGPMDEITGFPSKTLWATSSSMSTAVASGVAATIVALFLFFELAQIFNRSDNKGWDGIYWILMAFLKVSVALYICKHMTVIIGSIFEIQAALVKNIDTALKSDLAIKTNTVASQITDYYKEGSFWNMLGGWILALLTNLASNACYTIASIVCKLRFIEIYVFTAIAPLPFSTFASREYKSIGISYLKRLMALAMQGVFIAIVCYFYATIVNTTIGDLTIKGGNVFGTMFEMMGYSLLLLIAIFQTGGWAKSLFQVN